MNLPPPPKKRKKSPHPPQKKRINRLTKCFTTAMVKTLHIGHDHDHLSHNGIHYVGHCKSLLTVVWTSCNMALYHAITWHNPTFDHGIAYYQLFSNVLPLFRWAPGSWPSSDAPLLGDEHHPLLASADLRMPRAARRFGQQPDRPKGGWQTSAPELGSRPAEHCPGDGDAGHWAGRCWKGFQEHNYASRTMTEAVVFKL